MKGTREKGEIDREAEVNCRLVIKGSRNNVFARARGCTHRSRGTWHGPRVLLSPASSNAYESVGAAAPNSWERPRGSTVDGIARDHRTAIGAAGIFLRNLLKSQAPSLESRRSRRSERLRRCNLSAASAKSLCYELITIVAMEK